LADAMSIDFMGADFIVPEGGHSLVALDMMRQRIAHHIAGGQP